MFLPSDMQTMTKWVLRKMVEESKGRRLEDEYK